MVFSLHNPSTFFCYFWELARIWKDDYNPDMIKLKWKYLLVVVIFFQQIVIADVEVKNIGIPYVKNYQTTNIPAGPQIWAIDIGSNGFAYFANNDGVLEFDGMNWAYPLPSNAVVRSLLAGAGRRNRSRCKWSAGNTHSRICLSNKCK